MRKENDIRQSKKASIKHRFNNASEIGTLPEKEFKYELIRLVSKICMSYSQKYDEKGEILIASQLYEVLMNNKRLLYGELIYLIERGLDGVWDSYLVFTVRVFRIWISKFKEEKRLKLQKTFKQKNYPKNSMSPYMAGAILAGMNNHILRRIPIKERAEMLKNGKKTEEMIKLAKNYPKNTENGKSTEKHTSTLGDTG